MKIYRVGGAVRDILMAVTPKDVDYVVVDSNHDEMVQAGYEQVGKAFPVYLKDGCEYALARTEKKAGHGYSGFEVQTDNVSLIDDLSRRDLTVNAIAMDDDGEITDPFGGASDIRKGIIRHVSDAFSDDPLRVIRVARFAARWPEFTIALETRKLCEQISASGELDFLSQERIWLEVDKALEGVAPWRFFRILHEFGALESTCLNMFKKNWNKALKISESFKKAEQVVGMMLQGVTLTKHQQTGLSSNISRVKHLAELEFNSAEQALRSFQQARVFGSDGAWEQLLPILKYNFPDRIRELTRAYVLTKKASISFIARSQGIEGQLIGDGLREVRLTCMKSIL